MDRNKERIGSTTKEEDWIRKYRAALEMQSPKQSLVKAVVATFSEVAEILRFGMRSMLTIRTRISPNPAASKPPTKVESVRALTMPDRRLRRVESTVTKQLVARKRTSRQRGSGAKAS
jgi:hypothetical protein